MQRPIDEKSPIYWLYLEKRRFWNQFVFKAIMLILISAFSIPLILPYLWLIIRSFIPQNTPDMYALLWKSAAIAILGYFAAIYTALMADKTRNPTLQKFIFNTIIVILLIVFVIPHLSLENYRFFWSRDVEQTGASRLDLMPSIWDALFTSFIFAVAQTIIVTLVAAPAAYALSRFSFIGRQGFMRGLLMLHAFPALALTVAIFVQLSYIGLLNSLLGVILVMSALELPFAIFILKNFFDTVSWDIEMSAITDGASRFQAFYMVVLPQVKGGLIAIATFSFLRGWEEYVFVQTLLIDKSQMTMSLYLFYVAQDSMGADYGLIAAVGVIYLFPVLILYIFTQKYISQMNLSGIKG